MARKNLLKGLMEQADAASSAETETDAPAAAPAEPPRYKKGAIGAVSKSIADLKSRSVAELDPKTIRGGGVLDRLEFDEADHAKLMDSIKTYGQQVPILVRPHPENDGEYQIVYGRRRVFAAIDLGIPVKALIRDLDDKALVMAQGQENTARRDLSYAEKANFARQMDEAGYDRKSIGDALNVDKTQISRLLQLAEAIPEDLFKLIGSAPGIGRDRWSAFAQLWTDMELEYEDAAAMGGVIFEPDDTSPDARFERLHEWLEKRLARMGPAKVPESQPKAPRPRGPRLKTALKRPDGRKFGQIVEQEGVMKFELKTAYADGFDRWLALNIEEIHRDWLEHKKRGE